MAQALQAAATKFLLSVPEVVASVGKTSKTQKPFIFRDEILANLESEIYQATSAIVVEDAGPLASLEKSRYRARRLRVTIWATGNRNAAGILVGSKAVYDKIEDTFAVVDSYLHVVDAGSIAWADMTIAACDRIIDLSAPVAISEGGGIMIASAYYGVFY